MGKKTLYFDSFCGMESYAAVEDGKLTEFNYESQGRVNIIGNIYKGKVTDVLNGMQAAFVNCGLERNCYLSVEDLFPDKNKYDGGEVDIPKELNLKVGDEILVQVVKAPVGKKGAKVTTALSFVGKYLIFMPTTPFIGVSRKIRDPELRKNLLFNAGKMCRGDEGMIVRTAAPYANRKQAGAELDYYRRMYRAILEKFKKSSVGEILYTDYPLFMRVMRDTLLTDVEKIFVGNKSVFDNMSDIIKITGTKVRSVELHDNGTDMFFDLGLTNQILELVTPRVELENGAYLIIEKTEALTVIDVNTGKFTGDDSLEHTVYYTNILAAREIARQVRLRNIGGIVVVDFIDMDDEKHRASLVEELERALDGDKTKCNVLPMSKFGLVEFTRKRTGPSVATQFIRPCRYCGGTGAAFVPEFNVLKIRAHLLDALSKGKNIVCIDMNASVAEKLLGWRTLISETQQKYPLARVYIVGHRTYHDDYFTLRADASTSFPIPQGAILLY